MNATAAELDQFVQTHDIDIFGAPFQLSDIHKMETALNVRLGPQLRYFLTKYGYLGYLEEDFRGFQFLKATLSDHEAFPYTRNLVEIWSDGEFVSALVDSEDHVFVLDIDSVNGDIAPTGMKLFDFILEVFRAAERDDYFDMAQFFPDLD